MTRATPVKLLSTTLVPLALLLAAVHCGPSFQAVYEGDVQFEHCYAIDEAAHTALREKAECWRDWTRNYTYGQTRDWVEYAAARRDALFAIANNPTDEMLVEGAPGGGFRKRVISAPSPTSIFSPPPTTMADVDDAGAHGLDLPGLADAAVGPTPPAAVCTESCGQGWQSCLGGCDDAGTSGTNGSCASCRETYGRCMTACFTPDAGAKRPRRR